MCCFPLDFRIRADYRHLNFKAPRRGLLTKFQARWKFRSEMSRNAPTLLELARRQFAPRELSRAEENLFLEEAAGTAEGTYHWREQSTDAFQIENKNVIHGDCIAWLCADQQASAFVTRDGLCLQNIRIEGDVHLSFATVNFALRLLNCDFSGNIYLADSHVKGMFLDGCRIRSLFAWRVKVEGTVGLRCPRGADGSPDLHRRCHVDGTVNLEGAIITGDLDCSGAIIVNPGKVALTVAGARIGGSVTFRYGYKAEGETNLVAAAIAGSLECQTATFLNPRKRALTPNSAKIGNSVYFCDGFKADGIVDLAGAHINGFLQITALREPAKATFWMAWADVDTFMDDKASWPQQGNLLLEGFRYKTIHHHSPLKAKARIDWLTRQARDRFLPQPYEQLALVLREVGHDRDAKKVLVAKNKDRARFTRFLYPEWWWFNVFGRLFAYGYEPWRAFVGSIIVITVGTCLFSWGFSRELMLPTRDTGYKRDATGQVIVLNGRRTVNPDYPVFSPLVYSLECFTPLLKLDQSANWTPNANRGELKTFFCWRATTGTWLQRYFWGHIILGWVLTSLWIGAITGLLKS
jgi:hypothetical protein